MISLPSILVLKSGASVFIGSATRTAPPCNKATPAAAAESFAIASLSDIVVNPVACGDRSGLRRMGHLIQPSFAVIKLAGAIRLTMRGRFGRGESRRKRGVCEALSRSGTEKAMLFRPGR
ncbi:MAG: hypothetical protein GC147_03960 [Porphyrobacter sp.]|nr:hypothetical protein [Porphyrobacter sp.]